LLALAATAAVLTELPLPSFEAVRAQARSSDALILDRHGRVLNEIRVDSSVRRLHWLTLKDVSPVAIDAILAAEDHRFYSHLGFDPLALVSAIRQRLAGSSRRGASTLPMQLLTILKSPDYRSVRHERKTLRQKWHEIVGSVLLSQRWSKSEILEAYLNLTYFRGEIQGIGAASEGLFHRHPYALTAAEAAVLAALIRAPNASEAHVVARACGVFERIKGTTEAHCQGLDRVVHQAFVEHYQIGQRAEFAPMINRFVLRDRRKSSTITTTLDLDIQTFAAEALKRQVESLRDKNLNDAAVLVLDNASGDVLAYVGNGGQQSSARFVDGIRAERQAGSTLKPFLYGKAIEMRYLTAATLLRDTPFEVAVESGNYEPQNYDRHFKGQAAVREALAGSLNIPAVRTIELLSVPLFVQTLYDFGFERLQRPDFYGPSLALGSADVTLWELTNAYRALANDGIWKPARFLSNDESGSTNHRRVLSAGASFIIKDILSDGASRSGTFGLENSLVTGFWSAVKTGTSKDMRDNWCIGFSEKYTVGVWAGNFTGDSMWHVSGVDGAAPLWLEVISRLHRNEVSRPPQMPADVVARELTVAGRQRREVFLKGTEPATLVIGTESEIDTRISYPPSGTIIAMDPRTARNSNRVFFQISNPRPGYALYLNGHLLSDHLKEYNLWTPQPARYRLALKDSLHNVVDEVSFSVRGPIAHNKYQEVRRE
jgi:penicillin-binding protein 1C